MFISICNEWKLLNAYAYKIFECSRDCFSFESYKLYKTRKKYRISPRKMSFCHLYRRKEMRPVTEKISFKLFILEAFRSSNPIKTFSIKHLTLVKILSFNTKLPMVYDINLIAK